MEYRNGEVTYRDMTPEEEEAYEQSRRETEQREREEQQAPATDLEKIEAQTLYTALMTDTLLEE